MVNAASMSASSSSPSKPLSPHTPHTPAIPSRLSENSIIDYPGQRQAAHRLAPNPGITAAEEEAEGADDTPVPVSQEGTTAIDIPLSPRVLQAVDRRAASSVAHQHRSSTAAPMPSRGEDDDADLGLGLIQRSISLGADDREPPTMSTLLALQRTANTASSSSAVGSPATGPGSSGAQQLRPAADIRPSSSRATSSPAPDRDAGKSAGSPGSLLSSTPYRLRYPASTSRGGSGRSSAPPQQGGGSSSRGSFSGGGARFYRGGEDGADDEPLVFAMSELERDSRRSLEEQAGRGGGSGSGSTSGSASGPGAGGKRPGFEPRGTSKRGW
jgi:autophagy-related protein 13